MDSSFQRLGRGRRFRNKPSSEVPPSSGVSAASSPVAAASSPPPSVSSREKYVPHGADADVTARAPAPAGSSPNPGAPRVSLRARSSDPAPRSTRPGLHGQTLVSTGLVDLDDLLGGGLPLGAVMLLGSDTDSSANAGNASTLLRYFVAEGVASGHTTLWMPPREGARPTARSLPLKATPASASTPESSSSVPLYEKEKTSAGDGLRIAWQYRRYLSAGKALDDSRLGRGAGGLGAGVSATGGDRSRATEGPGFQVKRPEIRRLPEMCHRFDLTREIDGAVANTADLQCQPFDRANALSHLNAVPLESGCQDLASLRRAYGACVELIRRCPGTEGPVAGTVGRLALQPPTGVHPEDTATALVRFLRALRGALRGTRACAMVVFPVATLRPETAAKLRHAVDVAIDFETLRLRDALRNGLKRLLPDPELCVGLAKLRKMKFPGATAADPLTKMDRSYALQIRRRRMAIRPLRLAPDDEPLTRPKGVGGGSGREEKKGGSCSSGIPGAPDELEF